MPPRASLALFKADYDTYAVKRFEYDHKTDLQDGFYLGTDDVNLDHHDGTHLHIDGSIGAHIGAAWLVFQVGGGADIGGSLHVDLGDPTDKDGKLRLDELQDTAKTTLFDTSGDLHAGITAFFRVGIGLPNGGFVGYEKDFDIATVTWFSFSSSMTYNPFNPPDVHLATQLGSTLQLNTGPFAMFRNYEDNNPDENFIIGHDNNTLPSDPPGEAILVSAYGIPPQRFAGITNIIADLGDGNDVLTIGDGVTSPVMVQGGDGNKEVGDNGRGELMVNFKGSGSDVVRGGFGNNTVTIIGDGNNQVTGGQGDSSTTNTLTVQGNGDNLFVGGKPSGPPTTDSSTNDLTVFGTGRNKFVAGNGPDTMTGGQGVNTFIAGLGHDTINIPTAADPQQQSQTPNQISWDIGDGNFDVFTRRNLDDLNFNSLELSGMDNNLSFQVDPSGLRGGATVTVTGNLGLLKTITVSGYAQ